MRIRLIDGTTVPEAGRTAKQNNGLWRLHCAFDPPVERFSFFALTDEKGGEQLDRVPVAEGDILIADRGFMHPERLARVCEQGADIVVRADWKNARWLDAKGKPFGLLATLAVAGNAEVVECPIPVFPGTSSDRVQDSPAFGAAPRGLPQAGRRHQNLAS